MEISEIQKDSYWYVRRPGAAQLTAMRILDVTDHTVLMVEHGILTTQKERYKFDDLEFVEAF